MRFDVVSTYILSLSFSFLQNFHSYKKVLIQIHPLFLACLDVSGIMELLGQETADLVFLVNLVESKARIVWKLRFTGEWHMRWKGEMGQRL